MLFCDSPIRLNTLNMGRSIVPEICGFGKVQETVEILSL